MSDPLPMLSRRAFGKCLAGVGLGLLPVGFGAGFSPARAMADGGNDDDSDEQDDDNSGSGGGRDDSEDNSGHGGGGDDGPDDDSADDDDDDSSGNDDGPDDNGTDNSGPGNDGPDSSGDGAGRDDGQQQGSGSNRLPNVTVRYQDGWVELILNDQYQLIDNLNRQVILRPATAEDFNRMVALGS